VSGFEVVKNLHIGSRKLLIRTLQFDRLFGSKTATKSQRKRRQDGRVQQQMVTYGKMATFREGRACCLGISLPPPSRV
jgi:hypothetical protein